jgi:hypothetical protein
MFLTILLVILGIALVVVYVNRSKDEEKARLAIVGLTGGIVVVAILSLIGVGGGGGPQFDTTVDRGVGEVAAERIALVAKGRQVVLIADQNPHNPFARSRLEGFRARLAAHNMQILGIQDPWPTTAVDHDFPEEGVSAWGVEEALRNYPNADVYISLVGFPTYGLERVARDLEKVEFYALDENYLTDWVPYLRQGVLNGLVVPPYDSNWHDTSGSSEEVFDRRYVFVTRENLQEVAHRFEDPHDQVGW